MKTRTWRYVRLDATQCDGPRQQLAQLHQGPHRLQQTAHVGSGLGEGEGQAGDSHHRLRCSDEHNLWKLHVRLDGWAGMCGYGVGVGVG